MAHKTTYLFVVISNVVKIPANKIQMIFLVIEL